MITAFLVYLVVAKIGEVNIAKSKEKTAYSSLSLQKELMANIEKELQSTSEGAKLLQEARNKAEIKNEELTQRATSAENSAIQTQSKLNSKSAELSALSSQLSSKRAELEKAERGITLFNQAEDLFKNYSISANLVNTYLSVVYVSALEGNANEVNQYAELFQSEQKTMNNLYDQIENMFSKIQSGNY